MDVNLPFLGTGEASGPSVENFSIVADVGILAAALSMNNVVSATEIVSTNVDFSTTSDIIQSEQDINFPSNINVMQHKQDITVSANTSEIVSQGSSINGSAFEINVDVDMNVKGHTLEEANNQVENILVKGHTLEENRNIVVQANTDVYYYNLVYDILNFLTVVKRSPYYASKIVGRSSHIDELNLVSESIENGDVAIEGKVIQSDIPRAVDIKVPVTSIAHGFIDNFTMTGASTILDYAAVYPITSYAVSLSIPINMLGSAKSNSQPEFSMEATINSVDVLLSCEAYDKDSVRYEVADIDHGVADGKIKIFPNQWTMCFANKPVKDTGEQETVSSFLINKLVDKYGSDIHTKISMIVGKHPETGDEYNFVVQDGYITPEGSINDFNMCYLRDGAFYPIPFMVQSVSDETLEIDWAV